MLSSYVVQSDVVKASADKVIKEFEKYLPIAQHDLTYGYNVAGGNIYFITGRTEQEMALPRFEMPIPFYNFKKEFSVIVNLREYVTIQKFNETERNDLRLISRDYVGINHNIIQAAFSIIGDKTPDCLGFFKPTLYYGITAYAKLISSYLGRVMRLDRDPYLKYKIELAGAIFGYSLYNTESDILADRERLEPILINHVKLCLPYDKKTFNEAIDSIYKGLEEQGGNEHHDTYSTLNKLLKTTLDVSDKKYAAIDPLLNMLTGSWYGLGKNEMVFGCLGSYYTFIAMIYICTKYPLYKKTGFAMFLDANKRYIRQDELVKVVDGLLQDEKITLL